MTHSPTDWVFIELPNHTWVVQDIDILSATEYLVLSESPLFNDSGQLAEIGDPQ